MYIKCLLLLKLSTLATILSANDVNRETISSYPNHSIFYSAALSKRATEQSLDGSRIEFQIRNHQGPGTYVFGFDTGDGKNRQYRLEQRLRDGSIKGRYGFYDMKGKLKVINYVASPSGGYQERHHETIRSET